MTTPVWIGLGSNLGDRKATLDAAVAALADAPGVAVKAVSSYQETRPVGGPPGQGAFLNAAARLDTSLDPHQLLAVTRAIEDRAGRVREARWGERTLDLDLLIFGSTFLDTPELRLPHPRLALRRFVLAPMAEIAPTVVDSMTGRTVADLLANLDRRPRLLSLDGPPGRLKSAVFRRLLEELPASGIEDGPDESNGVAIESARGRRARATDLLARRVLALDPGRWPAEGSGKPWIVAKDFLDPRTLRFSAIEEPGTFADGPPSDRLAQAAEVDRWRERNRLAIERALTPIYVVDLHVGLGEHPRPGDRSVPSLRPDSSDPDAIVDEVLATCRGIEGA